MATKLPIFKPIGLASVFGMNLNSLQTPERTVSVSWVTAIEN
jgi:hypothetical protein